jgi:hypothetical protein
MGFFGIGPVHRENWRDHLYGRTRAFWVIAVIALGLLIFFASRAPIKTTVYSLSPRQNAWNACTASVEKELGLLAADAAEFRPIAVTLLAENRYQVDVRYPGKNAAQTCTVENTPDGKWQVVSREPK